MRSPSVSEPVIADRVCEPLTRGVAACNFMVRLIIVKSKYDFRQALSNDQGELFERRKVGDEIDE